MDDKNCVDNTDWPSASEQEIEALRKRVKEQILELMSLLGQLLVGID